MTEKAVFKIHILYKQVSNKLKLTGKKLWVKKN